MRELNKEYFLNYGVLTAPFLKDEVVTEAVHICIKNYSNNGETINDLQSLVKWVNYLINFDDIDDVEVKRFSRNCKEIYDSKIALGCTDYAILFATFARQLGIPTTILHTAEENWLVNYQNGTPLKTHYGHTFCECFYNEQWILIDPTAAIIIGKYDQNKIILPYDLSGCNVYYPYQRELDLLKKMTTMEHNAEMDNFAASLPKVAVNSRVGK